VISTATDTRPCHCKQSSDKIAAAQANNTTKGQSKYRDIAPRAVAKVIRHLLVGQRVPVLAWRARAMLALLGQKGIAFEMRTLEHDKRAAARALIGQGDKALDAPQTAAVG